MIKFKDIFTIITIFLGFSVLALSSENMIREASFLIILGSLVDSLDGFFARLTKTSNKFGAEFDCLADLVIFSMAPGILLFFIYKEYNIFLATFTGFLPIVFGCIRLARFNVKRIEYPGHWIGFPRPGSAWLILGLVNSWFFSLISPMIGIILIFLVGVANVSLIPYRGHHNQKITIFHKLLILFFILISGISLYFGYFWEFVFIVSFLYLISPIVMTKKEKAELKKFIKKWNS